MANRLLGSFLGAGAVCLALASCCCPPRCCETATIRVPAVVLVEALALRLPAASAEAVLGADLATAGQDHVLMDRQQDRAFRARAEADPGVETLGFPTILATAGEEATVFVGTTYREADDAWSGWSARCLATPLGTDSELALDSTFSWRPTPEGRPDAATLAGSEVRVGAIVARMPGGHSVLTAAPTPDGTGDLVAVLIRAQTVEAP